MKKSRLATSPSNLNLKTAEFPPGPLQLNVGEASQQKQLRALYVCSSLALGLPSSFPLSHFLLEFDNPTRQLPASQDVLVGQDRVGPSSKFWQAGAVVVSAGPTAVASRGRWVFAGASKLYFKFLALLSVSRI